MLPTHRGIAKAVLSAPFRKYLNVFIDPTCGWLRTVAQMRGLAYRSIPFRQAGGAAAYLAGPTDLPPSRRSVSFPDNALDLWDWDAMPRRAEAKEAVEQAIKRLEPTRAYLADMAKHGRKKG
jgi:hypothetical protein